MSMTNVMPLVPTPHRQETAREALQYHVFRSFDEAASLKEAWDDLAARVSDILCSFDWCELWWRFFGKGRRLEIHTLHDGQRLVAVLPLFHETIRPGGVWLRTVRVLGCDYTIETASLAVEPVYIERFTTMLLQALDRGEPWDILQIAPVRPYLAALIDQVADTCARSPALQTVIIGRQDTWCTLFDLPATYDDYLKALPGDERRNLLRRQRNLNEGRTIKITRACSPEEVDRAMDWLVYWHQTLWTGKGKPGQFGGTSAVEQFHRAIAQRLAKAGRLALITLKADGQVIGADYACFFGSRMHGLFRGYRRDDPWRSYGLGTLLNCHMIRHAIERQAAEIDAGRGIFDYKLRLGGKLHAQRSLVLVRANWSSRLRFWAALRTAYLIHVLYSRVWIDMIAPRLPVRPKHRHFHVRYSVLAQLHRRVRVRLFGERAVLETRCLMPLPPQDTNS